MATKPSTIFTFATDAVFGSGPANTFATKIVPGSITQGFIPGTGVNAEWVNYLFNITGQWLTDWLDLGSFVATLDAHLIETDALGNAQIAALELGNTASGDLALLVQENSGATGAAAILSNNSGGFAINASASGPLAVMRATATGSGDGIEVNHFGSGGGINAQAGPAGSSAGIEAFGGGLGGSGGIFTGGGAGGHGAVGVGTGVNSAGGIFTAPGNSDEAPLQAFHSAGGPFQRGTLHLNPSGIPTGALDGDVWKDGGLATFGRGRLQWWDDDGAPGGGGAGEQTAWSSENGLGFASFESLTLAGESAAVITTKVSGSIGINISPGDPDGKYVVEYYASVNLGLGAALGTRCEVEFTDASGVVETVEMNFASLFSKKPVYFLHIVDFVSIEALSIRFRSLSAGNLVEISNARIVARGAYE
jgi:hypothetical protein